jgi:hypothetical protein
LPICRSYFSAANVGCFRLQEDARGERAMTRKEAIDELREIQGIGALKVGHRMADDVLCRLLRSLGYRDVVAEYNKVGKWYDSQ